MGVKQDIFYPEYLGSNNYRIPGLLTTNKGTVLASIDARIPHGGDSPNNIDSAVRRSLDGGHTWEEGKRILAYPEGASAIDTCLVQDDETNRIYLIVTHFAASFGFPQAKLGTGYKEIDGKKYLVLIDNWNNQYTVREDGQVYNSNGEPAWYRVDDEKNIYGNNRKLDNVLTSTSPLKVMGTSFIHLIYSDDDGLTWSKPIDLNPSIKKDWMMFLGAAPGRGICIKNGEHKGRLVLPVYYTNSNRSQSSAVIYSDDHGMTWSLGESPNDGRVIENGNILNSETTNSWHHQLTECQVVEMPNGQLKLFMRNLSGYVNVATSFDGGATWHENIEKLTDLVDPYCQLTVINYSKKIDGKDALIFANPSSTKREDGTVRIGLINEIGCYDNGETKYDIEWKYSKLVKPGYYAYSCLTELPNGDIGLFYEGTGDEEMTYVDLTVDEIKQG